MGEGNVIRAKVGTSEGYLYTSLMLVGTYPEGRPKARRSNRQIVSNEFDMMDRLGMSYREALTRQPSGAEAFPRIKESISHRHNTKTHSIHNRTIRRHTAEYWTHPTCIQWSTN